MPSQDKFSWEKFNKAPIVGILRGVDAATLERIIPIYYEEGFSTIEITMNTEGATDLIAHLRNQYPALNVGAGTVCSESDLDKALMAGAQFIVTPILEEKVIEKCKSLGIPTFVGALTPTEIYKAWTLGASVVKVFPCSQFGKGYIKDIMAPLNSIQLLPTGGVTKENINDFLSLGVKGVGMGGSLFPNNLMGEGQESQLKRHLKEIYQSLEIMEVA